MLLTLKQAANFLQLKSEKAASKMLERLGVSKIDYALVGGKGVRYRQADIENALESLITQRQSKKQIPSNFFKLSTHEQILLLEANSPKQ